MGVASCPKGLREAVFQRDDYTCAGCKKMFPDFVLQLGHLIVRAGCAKDLRWSAKNLIAICPKCHHSATDEEIGFQWLNVTKFGDQHQNLETFWALLGRSWELEGWP